jgi:hypothetical protein
MDSAAKWRDEDKYEDEWRPEDVAEDDALSNGMGPWVLRIMELELRVNAQVFLSMQMSRYIVGERGNALFREDEDPMITMVGVTGNGSYLELVSVTVEEGTVAKCDCRRSERVNFARKRKNERICDYKVFIVTRYQ